MNVAGRHRKSMLHLLEELSVYRYNLERRDGTEASTEILCSCLCCFATSDR